MTEMTHLSHSLQGTEYATKYDEAAKKLIADKQVLARIVKGTINEFKDYTIDEIIAGIEKEPEIATKEMYPGKQYNRRAPGSIHGMNTESAIPGEGKVTYDIYFYVITREKESFKIIINIELQREYYVGYHFGARGVFYCSRMISEQLDKEFTTDNYDDMKKVYSIWICMNAPEKDANTITKCSMKQEEIYGEFSDEESCDFLSVIIIRLSGKDNRDRKNKLLDMLTVLLSEEMDAETKKRELAENHDMIMTEVIEGGVGNMCNLGEGLIEKYTALGEAQGAEKERLNTERERKRADEAEMENERLREEIERLKMTRDAMLEAERIAKDSSVTGYTDMDVLFAELRK